VELNKYLHDSSAAMWICLAIVTWLLCRLARRADAAAHELAVVAAGLGSLMTPALVVALATGGARAAAYTTYEYRGEITGTMIAILAVKHAIFAASVAWGVWVLVAARRLRRRTGEGGAAEE
jgi:ABC-type Co2+ transport system permease subunit